MLHLVCGPDRLENSRQMIASICALAKEGVGGQILIVPEQYSHETERALLESGGDSISTFAEVLSFSRLASRAFSVCGGVSREYLDEGGRILCLYLAAQNVLRELKFYAASVTRPDFLKQLGAMIEELMNSCLRPKDVLDCASHLQGQFAQKLYELGLLYESYLSVCENGKQDPVTRLLRLLDILKEQPFAEGKRIYIDGFSDFTGIQFEIVTALLQSAEDVTVCITTDGGKSSAFSCADSSMRRLRRAADRLNVPVSVTRFGVYDGRSAALSHLQKNLFAANPASFEDSTESLCFALAQNGTDECRFAAKTVRDLTSRGSRYRDIAIAVTDEAYLPQLKTLFSRAGFPAYYAGNEDILQQPLFAAIVCAVQAADRFEYEDVLQYLKSAWSPLAEDAVDAIEQYAFLWDIRGKLWRTPWTMHPRGYAERWEDEDRVLAAQLELWRSAAIEPLEALHTALHGGGNVGTQILALSDFLEKIELAESLDSQTSALLLQGNAQQAQRNAQLYEILVGALEQMYRVLGSCRMDALQFQQILKLLLGQYQVGTIPTCVDEVQIGPIMSFRHSQIRHLIILGAEDGKLPEYAMQTGLLSDSERQQLLSMGLEIAPAQEQALERELGWTFASISGATEKLFFVRSAEQPAWLLKRAEMLFPLCRRVQEQTVFLPDLSSAASALVRNGRKDETSFPQMLSARAQLLENKCGYTFLPLSTKTVQGLYKNPVELSASKIDRFASCRFAFFMDYGLKAKPWKKARFDAPIFGTFVHYVLEWTVREVCSQGGFSGIGDAELTDIASKHIRAYIDQFLPDLHTRGERFSYLFGRNLEEVRRIVLDVGRELRKAKFVPADEELSFERGGSLPPVRIEGKLGTGILSGKVDRVDVFPKDGKTYFRVIDYKTGRKDFDYADILLGEGLQMLLYLFALQRSGEARYGNKPQPAGVLYVPGRNSVLHMKSGADLSEAEKLHRQECRRKGLLLDDAALLQAMEDADEPEYLPVKRKKGELTGDLASGEQLEKLSGFVTDKVAELTDALLSGSVVPNPVIRGPQNASCTYCDFRQACHQDFCRHENRYIRKIGADEFWQQVEGGSRSE